MAVLTMAGNNKNNANYSEDEKEAKPVFHDFLGTSCVSSESLQPLVLTAKSVGRTGDLRQLEGSAGVSSAARRHTSATSDIGSERQVGDHFEGVPFYGPRTDFSGPEISNRSVGSKRSISDSCFMVSSRDRMPQMASDNFEVSHLMKMLRQGTKGDKPLPRPTSSLILQAPLSSKSELSGPVTVGWASQHPPREAQFGSVVQLLPSKRFRDPNSNSVPSIISPSAADEGSRTGIRGSSVILSSINNANVGGASERNSTSGGLPSGGKAKSSIRISEPESSTLENTRHGLASASRQMTIFYGGQAHVFDDVHPNKADYIMALAGSDGGSWSTTYSPKPIVAPSSSDNHKANGESGNGMVSNLGLLRETRGRLSVMGNSNHAFRSENRISTIPGGHQSRENIGKDLRNPAHVPEPRTEERREG